MAAVFNKCPVALFRCPNALTVYIQVVDHYLGIDLEKRLYIVCLLLPLILLSWVPNLKALAPVSMAANIFMGLGLCITVYYLVQDLPSPADLPQTAPLSNLPVFFSISIFAIEAIGAVSYMNLCRYIVKCVWNL